MKETENKEIKPKNNFFKGHTGLPKVFDIIPKNKWNYFIRETANFKKDYSRQSGFYLEIKDKIKKEKKVVPARLSKAFDITKKKTLAFCKKEVAVLKKIRYPYGKSYFWIKLWEKLFELPRVTFAITKITLRFLKRLACNAVIFGIVAVIIFGTVPSILSAPRSVNVATIEDWKRGDITTLDVSDTNGQIQLQPDGSWNKRVWGVPQSDFIYGGFSSGSSSVKIGKYIYITMGNSTQVWYRYDTQQDSYDRLPDLPFMLAGGSDLAFDGNNTIYMTFGGYSKKFYKYDTINETFTELPETLDTICGGSNVESNGTDIFVSRGCGATDFWKFKISDSSWESLSPITAGPSSGSSLILAPNGDFYMNRSNGSKSFYKYVVSTNTWSTLANTPDFPRWSSATLSLDQKGTVFHDSRDNKDYVYYINTYSGTPSGGVDSGIYSRYSFMIRYSIADNTWSTWNIVDDAPVPNINNGSMHYNSDDGLIYVIRGDGTYDLWKYDPLGGTPGVGAGGGWVGPQIVMGGQNAANSASYTLGTGSDMIWNGVTGAGGYLYVIRGNNTANFYRFDIAANTWIALSNLPFSANMDVKGTYYNGYVYIFRGASTREFYRYNVSTNVWSATGELADYSSNLYDGASLAYNASDGFIYALTGNGSSGFRRYDIGANTWTDRASMTTNGITYYANTGGRILSDGASIYAIVGDGEKAFLKYDTAGNTWSNLASLPFAPFYGTDITLANGKIYALAGYYRDETWEYTIAGNTWKKLPPIKPVSYERGPYNGASIEYVGGNSIYASLGQSTYDILSMTIGASNYASQGTYISQAVDLTNIDAWVSFTKNDSTPANTSITYETRTSTDSKNWSSWQAVIGTTIASTAQRYLQIRIVLASSDNVSTPVVYDWSVSYNSEDVVPTNPTNLVAKSQRVSGVSINPNTAYPYENPYFSWTGAADTGSGVAGYYVCFGTDVQCADPETDGTFQEAVYYEVNETLESGTYHLLIKTKDENGNIADEIWDAFTYIYNGVSPTVSVVKTSKTDFDTGTNTDISTSMIDGSLSLASTPGFWNEARVPTVPVYTYNGGELVQATYDGSTYFYSLVGGNRPNLYRYDPILMTWITSLANAPTNIYNGGALVAGPEGFLYASAGNSLSTFMRYDIAQNTWTTVSSAPQNFTYGATLTYDGQRYIYATVGNDNSFFRYDTVNNTWTTKGTLDFGNPEFTYQAIGNGADSLFDGNNTIYMTQGNGYPYFAKYTVNSNPENGEIGGTWTPLAPAPSGSSAGGNLTYDSATNAIYLFTGNVKNFFYKYDIAADTWSRMPDSPAQIGYGGSSIIYGRYIYIQTGDWSTTFLRYNLDENSWDLPQRGIFKDSHYANGTYYGFSNGSAITYDSNSNAYVTRGYHDIRFEKYNPLTGVNFELAPLPTGGYYGSALVYVSQENAIYYNPGDQRARRSSGRGNYFFKYDIATNTWTELTNDLPPAQTYNGSSMVYDGSRYIYLTRGNGETTWWVYDRLADSGSRWSTNLPTSTNLRYNTGSDLTLKDGIIYTVRGGGYDTFFGFTISGASGTWVQLANTPATINYGSSLTDGNDGYLYLTQGGNASGYYRYKISDNTWETLDSIPAQVNYGGMGMYAGNRNWVTAGGGTNTYSDGLYSYVVSSETNGVGFKKTGTYVSESVDLIETYAWANITLNYTQPANTAVMVETRTSSDEIDWNAWTATTNERTDGNTHTYSIESPVNTYVQVRLTLSSTDQILSPQIDDWTINYYQDIMAPTNPTAISAYSASAKINPITTETWYNYSSPYFEWPVADTSGGAIDNIGGSGIAGYYVYFGTDPDADPVSFQEETNYTATGLVSNSTYYFKIQAIDNAGMVATESYDAFTYKFDNVAPVNPSDIEVNPTGYSSVSLYTFTWEGDATDASSGLLKFQYRTGGDAEGVWTDIANPETVTIQAAPYQANKNTFYLRAVDNAGNISTPLNQDYYYSGGAASPPQNLMVDPAAEDNAANEFTFAWDLPESYAGDPTKLKYYYSINSLPTAYNTIETLARETSSGPFATQYGKNTFYIVAMNDGGVKTNPTDVDWNNPATVDFYAKTTAPGPPLNTQIFDTSDRENAEYSVALKWSVPSNYDEGNFAGYAIYRSLDNITFAEVAMTTGVAFVDTNLESRLYYYYVKSKDRTNNYSIATGIVSLTPTGRYTSPPIIVSQPKVVLQSYLATITWSTNRVASSFVEFGKSISLGETNGQVDSLTDHSVTVSGLDAGAKYYYRVKFIDPDGNIGTSEIDNFKTLPPPVISEVVISDVLLESAIVSWTTNASATCTLKYGSGSIEETSGGASHIQKITGLQPTTSYDVQIDCLDGDGNNFSSDKYSFTTPQQPIASEVTVQNKDNVDLPTVVIAYKTNVPTTTLIYFKSSEESSPHTYLLSDKVTEHQAEISDLDPAKEYTLSISGIDDNNLVVTPIEQKITTRSDSRPPQITTNRVIGRVIGRGNSSQANIYVKVETDEITTIKIKYTIGVTTNLEQVTPEDSLNTYHLITIPANPSQVYSYQIEAADAAGNIAKSEVGTVVVENAKANATEIITGTFSNRFGWISNLWKQ